MWYPPRPGIKPMYPALAGGFLTSEPPGESHSHTFNVTFWLVTCIVPLHNYGFLFHWHHTWYVICLGVYMWVKGLCANLWVCPLEPLYGSAIVFFPSIIRPNSLARGCFFIPDCMSPTVWRHEATLLSIHNDFVIWSEDPSLFLGKHTENVSFLLQ